MSKYMLIAVALVYNTNNLKAFSSAAATATAPFTPSRSDRPVETTLVRPESRGCLSGLFSSLRSSSQISPVGTGAGSPVPLKRHDSPVTLEDSHMAEFLAWREKHDKDDNTPVVTPSPVWREKHDKDDNTPVVTPSPVRPK